MVILQDCGAGEWIGADIDGYESSGLLALFAKPVVSYPHRNSWCDPFKTWQKVGRRFIISYLGVTDAVLVGQSYSFNPTTNLSEAEASLVLGGNLKTTAWNVQCH